MAILKLHFKNGKVLTEERVYDQTEAPPVVGIFNDQQLMTYLFKIRSNNLELGEADYDEVSLRQSRELLPDVRTVLDIE